MADAGGFFDGGNTDSGFSTETALTATATALQPPLIAYFYLKENRYFEFGKSEPEGAVIPLEIIGPGSPFSNSTYAMLDPSAPQISIGDMLRVEWLPMNGSPSFQSADVVVYSKDYWIPIAIPDSELKRLEGLDVEVTFFHLPQAGGAKPSPAQKVFVAPELGRKPVLKVEGVVNEMLEAAAFPDGITVRLAPIENLRACYGIEILWTQSPDHWVERQRRLAVNPKQTMAFHIAPEVYQPHVGHSVTVKYFIYLGARLSPNFFWNPGVITEVSFKVI
ncbi:hypothetical protein SAMN04488483_4444 [Pseudomonas helmanticensis]|uniref:Uncharacterized protein n=1 Tax=Pseudomonas helmanticensis TaxID=1471381 RepID=A0ACD2UAQ4_9PSED|nr:hypothetical protein [Pseudomonas helmanticensis]SMQ28620.1 hypothetical protein SAMN04488483_4444 [Pseudomonas helmanticensis]